MKLKDGFITYDMAGEQILVATGESAFCGLVRSNKTAAFIVNCLKEETTEAEILQKMTKKYDAPEDILATDINMILTKLTEIGALEL